MADIICCSCKKAGGVLRQLSTGKYQHISPSMCKLAASAKPQNKRRSSDVQEALEELLRKSEGMRDE